jgi:hypothetical protein
VSRQDLEALVTPKIAEAVQAAIDKIGRKEFEKVAAIDNEYLESMLSDGDQFVPVALVTLACQINKSHGDPNLAHSSVTECLKGTTIRIPPVGGQSRAAPVQRPYSRRRLQRLSPSTRPSGPLYDKKTMRVLSFTANLIGFLLLGYFLGGIAISPLIGESSCIGVNTSPLVVSPCGGSFVGLVLGVIGGLGYTYYYFARKL